HALPGAIIARLASRSLAGVIVEATHGDRARPRETLNDELHDGRGLLELAIAAEVVSEDRRDMWILQRVERGGISEGGDSIRRLHVTASHAFLDGCIVCHPRLHV